MLGLIPTPRHRTERKLNDEENVREMDLVQKKREKRKRDRVVNTAWGRNLECEMTNAVAQPTTRTCTA